MGLTLYFGGHLHLLLAQVQPSTQYLFFYGSYAVTKKHIKKTVHIQPTIKLSSQGETPTKSTWRQPAICIITTILCTAHAIWAVIEAPVEPAPGVSGPYVAAAVFVPLALWFGIWGIATGYLSCIFMALYVRYISSLPSFDP